MKGNCVDPNNEAPSFRESFGLDIVAEPRVMCLVGLQKGVCGTWVHAFRMRDIWGASGHVCNLSLALWETSLQRKTSKQIKKKSQVDTQRPWPWRSFINLLSFVSLSDCQPIFYCCSFSHPCYFFISIPQVLVLCPHFGGSF